MKKLFITIAILALAAAYFVMYILVAYETFGTFEKTNDEYCNKPLPKGYKLSYSNKDQSYAVKINDSGSYRNNYFISYIRIYHETSTPFSTFKDSCRAKAMAFDYIEQKKEERQKLNSYK